MFQFFHLFLVSICLAALEVGHVSPPVLVNGSGFTSATAQPPATGTGLGADAQAVARWDVVPFQTLTQDLHVGVKAFHMAGIDRVEFSLNGGAWSVVKTPSLNPDTNLTEYTATFRPADVPDGPVQLRAIAYPRVGLPRVLETLNLFANAHGSLNAGGVYVSLSGSDTNSGSAASPFRTLTKALQSVPDGGTVWLQNAGTYTMGSAANRVNSRWITVRPVAGLSASQVILTQPGDVFRPNTTLVHWQAVSFDFGQILQYYPEANQHVWFDQVVWFDSKGWSDARNMNPVRTRGEIGGSYVTDSTAHDLVCGFVDQSLVRHGKMQRISGDALQNSQLVLDVSIDTMDSPIADTHNDILQYFGNQRNVIVEGVNAVNIAQTQDIFLDGTSSSFTDMVFSNITVQNSQSDPPFSQLCSTESHILFLNVVTPRQSWTLRNDLPGKSRLVASNVLFEKCLCARFLSPPPYGVAMRNCLATRRPAPSQVPAAKP